RALRAAVGEVEQAVEAVARCPLPDFSDAVAVGPWDAAGDVAAALAVVPEEMVLRLAEGKLRSALLPADQALAALEAGMKKLMAPPPAARLPAQDADVLAQRLAHERQLTVAAAERARQSARQAASRL